MKKILLSLLAVAGLAGLSQAKEVNWTLDAAFFDNATANVDLGKLTDGITKDGITIKWEQSGSATSPAWNKNSSEVRNYGGKLETLPGNIITIKSTESISKIVFAGGSACKPSNITANTGTITSDPTFTSEMYGKDTQYSITWSGDAKEVVLTVNKFLPAQSCQWRYKTISFTLGAQNPDVVNAPKFTPEAGTYYSKQNVTISADAGCDIYYTLDGTAPTTASTKYTAAIEIAKTTTVKAIAAKDSKVSEVATAEYVISDAAVCNSIAECKAITDENLQFTVNFDLTVGFRRFSQVFCTDGKDWIQVYGALPSDIVAGSKINKGWLSKYKLFNNVAPELLPVSAATITGVEGTFTPARVEGSKISNDLVNAVITIPAVTFATATPSTKDNFEGVADGKTLGFRNNYELPGVEAGTYDVTVVVTIYNEIPSLYVIKYDATAGIEDATVDASEATYYNLQGVKVANPQAGDVVIRVQNGKATKIVK